MYDPCLRHAPEGELASFLRVMRGNVLRNLPIHRTDGIGRLEITSRCGGGRRFSRTGGRAILLTQNAPDSAQTSQELRIRL